MYNRREPLNPRLTANECKMKTKKKTLKTKQNQKIKKNTNKKITVTKKPLKTKQHYLNKHEIIQKCMQVSSIRKCSKTKTRPQDHETS